MTDEKTTEGSPEAKRPEPTSPAGATVRDAEATVKHAFLDAIARTRINTGSRSADELLVDALALKLLDPSIRWAFRMMLDVQDSMP